MRTVGQSHKFSTIVNYNSTYISTWGNFLVNTTRESEFTNIYKIDRWSALSLVD